LPNEIIFIFKAMHIVGLHNSRSGGQTRTRLMKFSQEAINAIAYKHTIFYYWWLKIKFWFKLFLFEHGFALYKFLFGFLEVKFDEQNRAIDE